MDGARHSARRAGMVAALVLGGVLALASCAPVANEADDTPTPTPTATQEPSPTPTPDNGGDGPVDPSQQTRRSGPAAEYGGPPYGDQGVESIGDGRWCAKVGFFWGGDAPPENVTFTIDGIDSHPAGAVTASTERCSDSPDIVGSCIGFTMTPETPFTVCDLLVLATPSFSIEAGVTFRGTLVCTEPRFCDAAIARPAEAGPEIFVRDPDPPDQPEEPEEPDEPPVEDPETPTEEPGSPESEAP